MGACQNSEVHKDQDEVLMDPNHLRNFGPLLNISSYTWKKDSYNLFDYEAKEISKQKFKTSFSGHFMRNGHMVSYSNEIDPKQQLLFTFQFSKDELRLEPSNYDFDSENSSWIVAKRQNSRVRGPQYHLLEGDHIKLGRVYFRLKEINIGKTPGENEPSPRKSIRAGASGFTPCRICLSDEFESDDPLISPCHCTGSLQYIHLRCLREWLNSKVTIKKADGYTYVSWEKLECELCKTVVQYQMEINGKVENLIDFKKPKQSLILETFNKKNTLKGFYMLNIKKKTSFKMGRAIDNEIRINDISVSRLHAAITVNNNQVFFNDFDSKFGSLILLRKPMNLKLCSGLLPIQIGRTIFKIYSSWNSQAADAICCKSMEDGKFLNPRNHEKIDEFEISEEGLEELSFEEMLMFSGNSVMVNQMVYSH